MAQAGGVQGFIEHKAEGPAFALAAFCMIARASQFYSGGAIALAHLLGPAGLTAFNAVTGVGLAAGCELLASIAGRQWQASKSEERDAAARRGLHRQERAALIAHFQARARLSFIFMCIGLSASVAAGFSFLQSSAGSRSLGAILGELVVTLLLVSVVAYLGIFKESKGADPAEIASAQAYGIRARIVASAGERIATGTYTPQDVRLVARALPRAERERFELALTTETADDPVWTVRDLAAWLGCDTPSGRRQITRKLARLQDRGAGVLRDDITGQYRIPRSVAVSSFAEDFLSINSTSGERRNPSSVVRQDAAATGARQTEPPAPETQGATATATGQSSAPDTRETRATPAGTPQGGRMLSGVGLPLQPAEPMR